MRMAIAVFTGCALPLMSACDSNLFSRMAALESADEAQKVQIEALEKRLLDAETKVWILEVTKNPYESATFDPAAAPAYQRVDTSAGTFAISIEDVKPHADGVKVRLAVGNLTTATFSGGNFKIKWGPRKDKTTRYSDWQKSLTETEQKFTNDLRPATWNKVTLTLPGVPPDKFGYLELSLSTDQIKLIGPSK